MSEQPAPDTSIPEPAPPADVPTADVPTGDVPDDPDSGVPDGDIPTLDVADGADAPTDGPRRWSPASLVLLTTAAAVLLAATAWHLGAVFLAVAPSNAASQRYSSQINAHVYPEFEQNWQLFAPNPLQDNIALQVRVQTLTPDGARPESPWLDLTAQDVSRIRGNPVPSHLDQNLLRRAWDYYSTWHNLPSEDSLGSGGPLSKEYLKRIALQRLGRAWHGDPINQIQFRIATTPIAGPAWTGAATQTKTGYQTLQWWVATDDDYAGLLP